MSRRGGGEEDWIWDSASKRGGAGAPLKQGANLRLAVHNQNSGARPYDDDEEEEQYNSHAHVRDNGRDSNSSTKNYSSTNASTPTKFMSSLRDMHSSMTNRDKESKFLKDKAYQDSLLAQIEEKRQRKQREKFQTDLELEKEMKLLSPMVMGSNPTKSGRRSVFEPSEGGAYDRSGDVKESQVRLREGGRARSPLEANGGGRTYANTRSADEEYSARYEQGARNDGGGRRGNERSDGGRGGHEVHGGAGGGRITDDDVVSRGEYDRLYTMYSQLLTSSEAMQRQLHLQADTIQQLQASSKGNGKSAPTAGKIPRRAQSMHGADVSKEPSAITRRSDRRPSSNDVEPKKAHNVAFGSTSNLSSDAAGRKHARERPAPASVRRASVAESRAPPRAASPPIHSTASNHDAGGGGGFNRLQAMAVRGMGRGSSVMYDQEDGGRGGLGVELRGESEYLRVPNTSAGDEFMSDDQLGRLMRRGGR